MNYKKFALCITDQADARRQGSIKKRLLQRTPFSLTPKDKSYKAENKKELLHKQ